MNDKITAADIMNYTYCPRILYITRVLKLPQTKSSKQKRGLKKEALLKRSTSHSGIIRRDISGMKRKYQMTLEYQGFTTKIDCMLYDEEKKIAIPIQYKYARRPDRIYKTMKMQLLFEGWLIEKTTGFKTSEGYIKFGLSNDTARIDLSDKTELIETISEIKRIVGNEYIPDPTPFQNRITDNCFKELYEK